MKLSLEMLLRGFTFIKILTASIDSTEEIKEEKRRRNRRISYVNLRDFNA